MSLSNLLQQLKGGTNSGNHGHQGRPGKRGGSAGKGGNVMSALDDLARKFDFVVVGSTAVKLQSKGTMQREPNDLDVIDLQAKTANSFDGYETDIDPRESTSNFQMYDEQHGVNIQTFRPGSVITRNSSEIRMPSTYKVSGEPNYDIIDGIKVLKPAPLLEQLYNKGANNDDIYNLIIGAKLPKDYLSAKWYRMMHDEAHNSDLR